MADPIEPVAQPEGDSLPPADIPVVSEADALAAITEQKEV